MLSPKNMSLLYTKKRAQHIRECVLEIDGTDLNPFLHSTLFVLCERFVVGIVQVIFLGSPPPPNFIISIISIIFWWASTGVRVLKLKKKPYTIPPLPSKAWIIIVY